MPEPDGLGALTISRRVGESVKIGEDITVEVIRAGSRRVRLRIVAPTRVPIRRVENKANE